ncbi:hypothetical protein TRIUR3_16162 [Triticum urartu]|uniref:DUF7890 domain-containing protein n=1 Tax=Triticum urartu TaxID=4572 RepID=M8AG07_TRIUA|nr:hypothetical protein TRIUR3_16162 [Triticum urartu]
MAVTTRRPLALLISRSLSLSPPLLTHPKHSHKFTSRRTASSRETRVMGNALPCLVDQGVKALPAAAKPRRRMYSLQLLMKVLHTMKKTTRGSKIGGKSSPESEVGGAGVKSIKASPRRAAAGRGGGGQRKGVVRVKVLLSKEEAARLLSLTVGGPKTAGADRGGRVLEKAGRTARTEGDLG